MLHSQLIGTMSIMPHYTAEKMEAKKKIKELLQGHTAVNARSYSLWLKKKKEREKERKECEELERSKNSKRPAWLAENEQWEDQEEREVQEAARKQLEHSRVGAQASTQSETHRWILA